MVRRDRSIRRHWILVYCAFSFCWWNTGDSQARASEPFTQPVGVPAAPPGARKKTSSNKPLLWPRLLRAVRAWLTPAHWLARCWSAFADTPAKTEFATLLDALMAGNGISHYLRL